MLARLRLLQARRTSVLTSAAVVAQVWRRPATQVALGRLLRGVDVQAMDDEAARRTGLLLAAAGGADVVDAHVASLVAHDDVVLTSDPDDLRHLLQVRGTRAAVLQV